MTIEARTVAELIQDTDHVVADLELKIGQLQQQMLGLIQQRTAVRNQAASLREVFARLFPAEPVPLAVDGIRSATDGGRDADDRGAQRDESDLNSFGGWVVREDWSELSRSEAVSRAIVELTYEEEFASPAGIERELRLHGRSDNRDDIGGALSYLNRKGVVRNRGRGRWIPGSNSLRKASSASALLEDDIRADAQRDAEEEAWEGSEEEEGQEAREAALIEAYERQDDQGF